MQYLSNLHKYDLAKVKIKQIAPNIAIAGNVGNTRCRKYTNFFDSLCKDFNKVILIPGPHDYLSSNILEATEYLNFLRAHNHGKLHILNNDYVIIDGVRIIGSTFWPAMTGMSALCDDQLLRVKLSDDPYSFISPKMIKHKHRSSIEYITRELRCSEIAGEKVVLVTCFSPSLQLNSDKQSSYIPKMIINNYASSCDHLFKISSLKNWIVGEIDATDTIYINDVPLSVNSSLESHKIDLVV